MSDARAVAEAAIKPKAGWGEGGPTEDEQWKISWWTLALESFASEQRADPFNCPECGDETLELAGAGGGGEMKCAGCLAGDLDDLTTRLKEAERRLGQALAFVVHREECRGAGCLTCAWQANVKAFLEKPKGGE